MKEELKDLIIDTIGKNETFADSWELYQQLDYSGCVHEIIDSNIDIYYYTLRQWSVDNYHWVDDAIAEGLAQDGDFHQMIQAGQYLALQDEANGYIEELFTEMSGEYFNIDQTKSA